ncbi:outer membrane protein, partial [Mangrovibacterium sp.]|uniref:outer membrane protein n=1 Tax=Mangrovibacterium sp. TaxID=1961364 RepID=UPI0035628264
YNSGDGGKTSSFDFSPAVGYFVANNLAFGIMLELSTTTEKDDYDKYTTSSSIVMPFAVYYFGKSNVKPYVQGGLGPGWGKEKSHPSGDPSVTIKTNLFSYAFGGGLAIFLYDNIALDFGLGYASATSKWKDLSNVEWKNTMNGFSSSIGISVIF